MSDSKYNHSVSEFERLEEYEPGGFHPVCLGGSFKEGRYKVLHKMRNGAFSTVWAARDLMSVILRLHSLFRNLCL